MRTTDVRIWAIRQNKSSKRSSFEVRWKTADKTHSATRRTKALADSFQSDLRQAAKRGEEFDVESGLPISMLEAQQAAEPDKPVTFLAFAQEYVTRLWPHDAPKTRDSRSDALATVIPALTADEPGRPDAKELRGVLRKYLLLPPDKRPQPPDDVVNTIRWLETASLPITALGEARHVRAALDALTVNMDGTKSGATTIARKRGVFFNILEYAVEIETLPANPIPKLKWKPPKTSQTVDPRVVVNPDQARALLEAVKQVGDLQRGRGERLSAMFACMYYAAMRPSEVIGLRKTDCKLPAKGWGTITLSKSRPEVNTKWSDTGDAHEERGLKHRAEDDVRPVPIPPVLVKILRAHIDNYGVTLDGRLFRSERGKPVASTAYTEVWQKARRLALTPEQVASPMAGRPYDLRHAAVSLWLNGGVAPTEIAQRAGHSVEVLLRVYAKCVSGQEEIANRRIEEILSTGEEAEPSESASGTAFENRQTSPRVNQKDAEATPARRRLVNTKARSSNRARER
jgi:integrase